MDRVAHYLRPNGSTRLPRTHFILDTESTSDLVNGAWRQSWRLAVGAFLDGHVSRGWRLGPLVRYPTPLDLWADLNAQVKPERRLVVWCHNLAYDLRISGALSFLPAMGFELEGIALDHAAGWVRFTRDTSTVLMVDLASWLPAPLAKIAEDLGIDPVDRPGQDAPAEQHYQRCESDVTIAARAIVQLLDLLDAEDLGPWRPTGAGQSHSAWRRRFLTHRCLIHDSLDILSMEREAAWTGRCEAWRHGPLEEGPYTEFDLSLAYCQIAADSEVPTVLAGSAHTLDPWELADLSAEYAVLARVEVKTDEPVIPCLDSERILWPVGEFTTALWDPELTMALDAGAQLTVSEAWLYRRAPALQEMARWIIDRLTDTTLPYTAVHRRLLKHWARALVGRCALRYRVWEKWGTAETEDVTLGMIEDLSTGHVSEMMQVGTQLRVLSEQVESPESLPQIPGWIMAECRRRLWRLMGVCGHDHLIYVDTDSLIVDQLGARRLRRLMESGRCWPLHVKGTYQRLTVHGPRMLEVDGERRMAGIPLQARLDEQGRLAGEVFLSLKESLLRHQVDTVEVLKRTYDPASTDRRRRHLTGGRTAPIVLPTAS